MLNKLGKLLKYEFRFYLRLMPPIYLILVLLAMPAGFQMKQSGLYYQLLTVIWGIIIGAMTVMTVVLIIQRFTDNFLKNPGSLMFTLPVTTWALTASKAIAALCMVLMSVIVITVSALIYAWGMGGLSISTDHITLLNNNIIENIEFTLVLIIMIFQQICLIYAAISASHILPRFRLAAGVVIYFVVMNFVEVPVSKFLFGQILPMESLNNLNSHIFAGRFFISFGLLGLVFAALFFWLTGFLLQRTLNLE